jgi:Zinc dependent phospholipase C
MARPNAYLAIVTMLAAACSDAGTDPQLPPGELVPFWETLSPTNEAQSTHLWIVDRAVDVLGKHQDLRPAAAAYRLLRDPTCLPRWQQGLIDADYKAAYNNGTFDIWPGASEEISVASGATWKSHFYDPDSGTNWLGESSPTARTEALGHLRDAQSLLKSKKTAAACYELGLSLHYLTDVTQPMHASNYTATDWPVLLHSHIEGYAMGVQSRYAVADWNGAPTRTASAQFDAIAKTSKLEWPPLFDAVVAAYASRCGGVFSYASDDPACWQGDAGVDARLGASLRSAQIATAEFLFSADLR